MARLTVDIEDAAGRKLGAGPITSAGSWRNVRRLNRAGEFSFVMPAADERRAYATAKRVVRGWWHREGYAPEEIGAGLIDSRRIVAGSEGGLFEVAGDDLLRELVSRSVGFLALRDLVERVPDQATFCDDAGPTYTAKANLHDGNGATTDSVPFGKDDYLYIGDADPFSILDVDLSTLNAATVSEIQIEYWDGSAWTRVEVDDGTAVGDRTLAQDGQMEFERQTDWTTTAVNGTSAYWVRLALSEDVTITVNVAEITVLQELPVSDALTRIMAYAPSGWALDTVNGYETTGGQVYAKFAGESVLAALCTVSEIIGENFILSPAGRRVCWLRDDVRHSGLRAIGRGFDGVAVEANPDVCLITDLEQLEESYDLVTRIYPYGAGNGHARLTIATSDWTPPAGYTVDRLLGYIESDDGVASYGRVERHMVWGEIAAQKNTATDTQFAANQLLQAAYEELSRHDAPQAAYTLSVTKLDRLLLPGQKIRVHYHEWRDGFHAIDIDDDLWILETDNEIDQEDARTVGLTVATTDTWPGSDADASADVLADGQVSGAHAQHTMAYALAGPYTGRINPSHPALFTARLGAEVLDLGYARLRFKSGPLISSISSVAGQSTTSDAGGGATVTSASGGGTTVTSASGGGTVSTPISGSSITSCGPPSFGPGEPSTGSDGSHDHTGSTGTADGSVGDHAHTISSAGSHTHTVSAGHDHSIVHNHSVDLPSHTHSVTIAAHTHSITLPAHSHTLTPNIQTTYGLYEDSQRPSGLHLSIDGVDATTGLGGPWAAGGEAVEIEADITAYLTAAPGGLRQRHRLQFTCTGGQGELECEVDMFVAVQAIEVR